MAAISQTAALPGSRNLEGILCICIGMSLFVFQDALMKSLLGPHTLWELMSLRALLSSLVLIPAIVLLGPPNRLLTPLWPLHTCRAFLFAAGFSLFYTAFPFMTLASVSTIFFAAPLFTAVLAAIFLHEKIGIHRCIALLAGFVGVLIAMRPGSDSFQWVAVLPLLCALTYAISQVIARWIGDRDTTITTGAYTIVLAGLFMIPLGWGLNAYLAVGEQAMHLRWEWTVRVDGSLFPLLALGTIGMLAYLLLSRAYQVAEAGLVAPLEYTYLPIATVLGYLFWDEVPAFHTIAGMALIIASGLYVAYRELLSQRRSHAPAPTAEASFVPGNLAPPVETATAYQDPAPKDD